MGSPLLWRFQLREFFLSKRFRGLGLCGGARSFDLLGEDESTAILKRNAVLQLELERHRECDMLEDLPEKIVELTCCVAPQLVATFDDHVVQSSDPINFDMRPRSVIGIPERRQSLIWCTNLSPQASRSPPSIS